MTGWKLWILDTPGDPVTFAAVVVVIIINPIVYLLKSPQA